MARVRPASVAQATHAESHPAPGNLSDFILGSQDGLVNVLGILLGLASSGQSRSVILIATLAALAAETISMGAVAYTSTRARRLFYLSEQNRERWEMEHVPELERAEVSEMLEKWEIPEQDRASMLDKIVASPKAMLDLMMAFELHLAPVASDQPRKSAILVGLATVAGSILPIVPFLVTTNVVYAAITAVVLAAGMLFAIGGYEARTTVGSVWASGLRMLTIGLVAGFAGFLVGIAISAFAGI